MKKVDLTPDLTNPVCGCLPPAALVIFSDEATKTVARDKLLAVQLEARLGRGVVVLEPLFDGAAFVRMAIQLSAYAVGWVKAIEVRLREAS